MACWPEGCRDTLDFFCNAQCIATQQAACHMRSLPSCKAEACAARRLARWMVHGDPRRATCPGRPAEPHRPCMRGMQLGRDALQCSGAHQPSQPGPAWPGACYAATSPPAHTHAHGGREGMCAPRRAAPLGARRATMAHAMRARVRAGPLISTRCPCAPSTPPLDGSCTRRHTQGE